jgi:hypothetical protein
MAKLILPPKELVLPSPREMDVEEGELLLVNSSRNTSDITFRLGIFDFTQDKLDIQGHPTYLFFKESLVLSEPIEFRGILLPRLRLVKGHLSLTYSNEIYTGKAIHEELEKSWNGKGKIYSSLFSPLISG